MVGLGKINFGWAEAERKRAMGKKPMRKKTKKVVKSKVKKKPFLTIGCIKYRPGSHDFKIRQKNGELLCFSNQGYSRRHTMRRILKNMLDAIKRGDYEIVDLP